MQDIDLFINKSLLKVNKPAQYIAHELNIVQKDWQNSLLKVCYLFPDRYEIGMSNLALQIFYNVINNKTNHLLERCFLPQKDMEDLLKKEKVSIFSLESKKPLIAFDAIAISFPSELNFTNALLAFELANIPFKTEERIDNEEIPLIFAGGGGIVNPLPMSNFIDFFVIGDGENVFEEIIETIYNLKNIQKLKKQDILKKLNKKEYIFVPSMKKGTIKRNIYKLDNDYLLDKPIIPLIDVVHNRFSLEIMKGCPRTCRFCQASYINKPLRIRKKEELLSQGSKILENTGYDELSLSSLSSGDYPDIIPLLISLDKECSQKQVSLSLPSLRVDSFTNELSFMLNKVKQSGVTIAPEAGSQFLREVIKKQITEEDILNTAKFASENSNKGIKMYFMIGLPREEMKDLEELISLIYKIMDHIKPKKNRLIVNVSNFVPKPFTPFQWCAQNTTEELEEKLNFLKKNLRHRQIELRWTDVNLSKLETILSRGDEKIGELILEAYKNGACFDSWYDRFSFPIWEEASRELKIDMHTYLKEYSLEKELKWSFIDMGISLEYLKKEYFNAYKV
jgi:radical SAM family uncharacterized protein